MKVLAFVVNGLFYGLVVALPVYIINSFHLNLKRALIPYLKFTLICFGILILVGGLFTAALAAGADNITPRMLVAFMSMSLPASVHTVAESALLAPLGTIHQVISANNVPFTYY